MDIVPFGRKNPVAYAAVRRAGKIVFGKSQVGSVAVLINAVVGDLHSTGVDAEHVIIAVVSAGSA